MEDRKRRKKYLIKTIHVSQQERHLPFEIKLPFNVKRITGVIITATLANS